MPPSYASLAQMAADLGCDQPAPHKCFIAFGELGIMVESNSQELIDSLCHYYQGFVADPGPAELTIRAIEAPVHVPAVEWTIKQPDPGKERIKENYIDFADGRAVYKVQTGMLMLFGPDLQVALGPCLVNDNQVVNFINSRHIQWLLDQGWLLCHCAAVARGDKGLALAGFAGAGKSTLSLHLMSQGLTFISNDRLLIKKDPEPAMVGVAKLPRINPGTALNNPDLAGVIPEQERERFDRLAPEELWELEHKYDVFIDEAFGDHHFRLTADLGGLVILNWHRLGGEPVLSRVDLARREDLLGAVMKSPGVFFQPRPDREYDFSPAAYLACLADTPVYELTGGADFARAVEFCLPLMD